MKVVRGLIALVLTAALVGCSGITVRRAGAPHLFDAWQASAGLAGELSPRSLLTLRRLDLEHHYLRSPADAIGRLHTLAVQDPQPEYLFALAAMSYLRRGDGEKRENGEAG